MSYDIFISYSRRDNHKDRVTQLVERIKANFAAFGGHPERLLQAFFDQHPEDGIKGMDDWRHKILQGLRESRLFLACLSPAYLQSEYCEWEFNEYLKHEIGRAYFGDGVAPIYFVEVPGWENKGFEQQCAAWVAELRRRQNFDLRPWFHAGEESLRDVTVQERMRQLNAQLKDRITRGERAEHSLGNVDAHNPHFIGRTTELRRMRETVALGKVGVLTAVHGLGGVGKTALAIEYANAFAHEYGGGCWQVRCEGKEDLCAAIAELAAPLALEFNEDEKNNTDRQFQRVLAELRRLSDANEPHRCLLLLDNVDKPRLIEPAQAQRLPAEEWLHIIATTRLGESELHGKHKDRVFLPVDELPEADALELIETFQPCGAFPSDAERKAAREIVNLLGRFTLAIETAAVYLGQFVDDVTCAGFLARLKKEGLAGLDTAAEQTSEGVRHGEKRLAATLTPTLERLNEAGKLALSYAALLPADYIALPWIRALVAEKFPNIGKDTEPGYPDPWKNVLRCLFSLRLLQATDDVDAGDQPRVVRVHRLVSACVRDQIIETDGASESGGRGSRFKRAIISLGFQRCIFMREGWMHPENLWEIAPLHQLARLLLDQKEAAAITFCIDVANHLQDIGDLRATKDLLEECLGLLSSSGPGNEKTLATVCSNTASVEQALGNYSRAKELFQKAKEILEGITPWDYRALGQVSSNLAMSEMLLHNHDAAIRLAKEGVGWLERWVEPNDPDLATAYCNLALLEKDAGNFEEAREVFGMALGIWSETLPQYHPQFSIIHCNLARLEEDLGNLEAARHHLEQAIEVENRVLPESHPERASTLFILARVERKLGRPAVARKLLEEVLRIEELAFAVGSPKLAGTYSEMGRVLVSCGVLDEAHALLQRVLTAEESQNGPDHPVVIRRCYELADIAIQQGRKLDAQIFMRRIVESIERTLGPEFETLMTPLTMLGAEARAEQKFEEARALLARAASIGEVSSSKDYEQRVMSHLLLGSVEASLKHMPEAVEQFRRAHQLSSEHLPPDHPLRLKATETVQQIEN